MVLFFGDPDDFLGDPDDRVEQTDEQYLPIVPRAVLRRHEARVLDRTDAALVPRRDAPLPTMYRVATLLVPGEVLAEHRRAFNAVLGEIGLQLQPHNGEGPPDLPRPARLAVKTDGESSAAMVDAWAALQYLRAAAEREEPRGWPWRRAQRTALDRAAVDRISVDHLLLAARGSWSGVEGAYTPSDGGAA